MSLLAGTRLGSYEIGALLGVRGMGEVHRATDTTLKRQVAIKVLPESVSSDADRLARLQREAEALAALNHPNIAQIFGLERSGGTIALVMKLVEGPTLAERIAKGAVPLDEALAIATQIAGALAAAHEHRISHRDLKPANIKVREDGTVKVLDFGLAKAISPVGASTGPRRCRRPSRRRRSPRRECCSGPPLISPEQARGRAVDKRSDLWAFGAVLYEILATQRAFGGEDVSETLAHVLMKDPDWTALPAHVPMVVANPRDGGRCKRRSVDPETLRAGAAHELCTPLSTISTAAGEVARRRTLFYHEAYRRPVRAGGGARAQSDRPVHGAVVVLTGYGSVATALKSIRLGALHYLTKPTTPTASSRRSNPA